MSTKPKYRIAYKARKVEQAVRYELARPYAQVRQKLDIEFDNPSGLRGRRTRNLKVRVTKEGHCHVRAFNGLWILEAKVWPVTNGDGTAQLKNLNGVTYRARIHFQAVHVLWFDELGKVLTPNQCDDAVNLHVYRSR